ncbi:MAG: transglutaminase domain-containing protein, partial [Bacteroidales bacterium]|nr:transglutaminase domain-containing protein [Bacteroidales bacterium]
SIKKFDGNSFNLLAYDAKDPGIDDGMTLSTFDHPTPLDEGYYILTSGTRLEDGTALTHSEFFTIKAGETTKVKLVLREHKHKPQVIGHFDAGNLVEGIEGYYILGLLDQGSEPTTHALNDIDAFRESFDKTGIPMFLINDSQTEFEVYRTRLTEHLGLSKTSLPIFIIGDADGEVFFMKQGYTIGLGEQLLKVIAALN